MQEKITYEKVERERVDSYLASVYKDYSRSYFQKLTNKDKILVNGKSALSSHKLMQIEPEQIRLDIIYEDDDIIVINKQHAGTLLNALMAHFQGKYNPYLVHRLDKDTSGVIVFAKNEKAKISISKQLQKRAVKKIYLAVWEDLHGIEN